MSSVSGMRCAVIGATGFVGSHLTERLVEEGARVLAIARSERRHANLAAVRRDIEFLCCDITTDDRLIPQLVRFAPQAVFHLVDNPDAAESFAQMRQAIAVNSLGTLAALEAATAAHADQFIFGDSAKIYGNGAAPYRASQTPQPTCSYAIGKAAAWQLCLLARSIGGPTVTCIRPTLLYGPRQPVNLFEFVRTCARDGRPVHLLGGQQTRAPLFIADAVDAFVRAAIASSAKGQVIPIGGAVEITVLDLARAIIDALGVDVRVESTSTVRATEIYRCVVDNSDAESILGWKPRTALRDGLLKTFPHCGSMR